MNKRKLISQEDIREAVEQHASIVVVPAGAIVTDLARELAKSKGIKFGSEKEAALNQRPIKKTVAVGSDHGGFEYKKILKPLIVDLGWQVIDVGTDSDKSCDYPDFAYAVSRLVRSENAGLGLMIDGAGVGSAMVCNKVPGIRAACAYNEFVAWNSRAHNNANVLTLGSRTMGIEVCKNIVKIFLETSFEGGRHQKRTDKISDVERHFRTPGK